jgi:hypothetical protein
LEKIKKYKYVFITESYPLKIKSYNKDIPHGPDFRFLDGSGVYLDKHPFNIGNINLIMSVPGGKDEKIETFLIENI